MPEIIKRSGRIDTTKVQRWAMLDPSGTYRYVLGRQASQAPGKVLFILLNPSTADAVKDDPTVRRCVAFARQWGYGYVELVDLFAFRASSPSHLKIVREPVGPRNDGAIKTACDGAQKIVAAWGNHGSLFGRARQVALLLRPFKAKVFCFGLTNAGQPRHPLYLRKKSRLIPFSVSKGPTK